MVHWFSGLTVVFDVSEQGSTLATAVWILLVVDLGQNEQVVFWNRFGDFEGGFFVVASYSQSGSSVNDLVSALWDSLENRSSDGVVWCIRIPRSS